MVRLEIDRDSYGSVRDPETDEHVDIDAVDDPEVARRIADAYDPITVVEDDDTADETDELDALLDGTVPEVTVAIESGEYDDRLDELADRADRTTVQSAIADRRGDSAE